MIKNHETDIWFKVIEVNKTSEKIPTAIYLHGGPGYNSFTFEKSVSHLLSENIRMVYLDQRGGSGRTIVNKNSKVDLNKISSDLEMIRLNLGLEKISLIGHSFGGLVALEFLKRYPKSVDKIILVDIAADLPFAFNHQIKTAFKKSKKSFPQHTDKIGKIIGSKDPVSKKLEKVYETIGRLPLQKEILFSKAESQNRMESWDKDSGLMEKENHGPGILYSHLIEAGYLDSTHEELRKPISVPVKLFAGTNSHCIGTKNIKTASKEWEAPIVWFDSGHFVYLEKPDEFSKEVISFFSN